ncbi:MAG: hypothetical protein L0H22_04795 [Brevibacterium aurantiacum]|nr:hypothetical protein [Brevibacterium aurantiacum]
MYDVQLDEEVWAYLRARVRDFNETPNAVLRRELGLDKTARKSAESATLGYSLPKVPDLPVAAPVALRQIMSVVSWVICGGLDRAEATKRVAEAHQVVRETVADKYGRQLGLSTHEFDALLKEKNLGRLKNLLVVRFTEFEGAIVAALQGIAACRQT